MIVFLLCDLFFQDLVTLVTLSLTLKTLTLVSSSMKSVLSWTKQANLKLQYVQWQI